MLEHRGFMIQNAGDHYQVFLPCGDALKLVLDDQNFKSAIVAQQHIDDALNTLENLLM